MNFACWASGTWAAGSWVVGSWCPGAPVVVQTGGRLYIRRLPDILETDDDALAILLITEILLND